MNHSFKKWTRSTAFCLTLTERAIKDLLDMEHFEKDCVTHGKQPGDYGVQFYQGDSHHYLMRRGLIRHCENGNYCLTEEGTLVCQLLRAAGFAYTGMNTDSVFRPEDKVQ